MVVDSNSRDFLRRLSRIEKAHRKGYGFEAPGTLGRSTHRPRRHRRARLPGLVLAVVVSVILLKAIVLFVAGEAAYQAHVAAHAGNGTVDLLLHKLLAIDPLTREAASLLTAVLSGT